MSLGWMITLSFYGVLNFFGFLFMLAEETTVINMIHELFRYNPNLNFVGKLIPSVLLIILFFPASVLVYLGLLICEAVIMFIKGYKYVFRKRSKGE